MTLTPTAVADPSWLPPIPPGYAPTEQDIATARADFASRDDYAAAVGALHAALRLVLAGEPFADVAVRYALALRLVALDDSEVTR
ncbi:hypothetical protein [Candidatus Frankia alpina]|uniref:Uncharacterized protein n=1 Tax=Candidatus Frankia alpina TaxID=2699483 RepID=A0A4S5ER40_9ACTN|nr:hypothetical protein [Candidatus Frankia alpina]THJ74851.1 hypothetical protein E7Y31_08970 [Candidatus Frankia alpina]